MSELQQFPTLPSQPFRLDVPLHELLQQPSRALPQVPSLRKAETLPTAVFPQYPWLFHDLDEQDIAAHETVLQTGKRHSPRGIDKGYGITTRFWDGVFDTRFPQSVRRSLSKN